MDDTQFEQRPNPPVWFLSAEELVATREKLATITGRAARKGFTGSIELLAAPATRTQPVPGGFPVTVHGFDVTIIGEAPRYAGWRFVASVDAVDGGTILRYPPGREAPVRNTDVVASHCDHCHTRRPRRRTMLIAHDDTGQLLQVGTSCLKDFLGHHLTPVYLTADDVRAELGKGLSGTPTAWDLTSVLTYAWAAVKALGWTPASAEPGRTPTRDVVRQVLTQQRAADRLLAALAPHLAEGRRLAPRIINTLLTGLTGEAGYEANLAAVLRGQVVDSRHLGLAVSAIPAHQRLLDQRQATTADQDGVAAASVDHVGVVGDKITLAGTVRTAIRVDGYTFHSPDSILLILDCGAAVAKMTTAAAWAYQVKVGDPLTLTGTVKAHTVWNGVKQTVLTRPKKLDQPAATLPQTPPAPDVTGRERVDSPRLDGASADRKAFAPTPTPGLAVPR
ncbi:MAG: hypothetical protein ACYC1E_18415 [Propionibacteriaceae bacterium]